MKTDREVKIEKFAGLNFKNGQQKIGQEIEVVLCVNI